MTGFRTNLGRGVWLGSIAMAALIATQPAAAQDVTDVDDAPTADTQTAERAVGSSDADIVVTARRRNEILLDVPIAVTAYSGEQLERQGAVDITDIGDTTPNVTLETSRGTNTTLTAFIRGIGQQDPVAGFEQGVGLYLDDVYLNRPQGAVLDIYDVERIEVLRGPQGTLYGRNTIGGAVKYVTRRLPHRTAGNFRTNIGTYGQVDLIGSASTAFGDMFRVGAAVARLTRDGFGSNFTTREDNYDKDITAGRVSAEIGDDDRALLRLSGDYTRDVSNARGGHRLIPGLLTGAPVLENEFNSRGGLIVPEQKVTNKGAAAHGHVRVADGVTLKSITAYRKDLSGTPIDFDALPSGDVDVPAIYRNKQFSQEVQLEYGRGPISGVVGAYYLDAKATTEFDVRLFTTLAGLTAYTLADVDTKTWAIFGDFTYDVSDQISLSVGGRYTDDRRKADVFRTLMIGGGAPAFGGPGTILGAPTSDFEGRRKDTAFTPRASVSFKPTPDHHLYASFAQGFKGGGFDPRGQSTQAPDADGDGDRDAADIYEYMAFDPEKVKSYELGWKAALLDRRVFTGVSLFHSDYKDMQIPASVGCIIGGLPNFCGLTSNAGKARIRGVEFEGNARLLGSSGGSQRLNFGWSLGYLDAAFQEFLTIVAFERDGTPIPLPGRQENVADFRKIQNTPKWTASGTLTYLTDLMGGDLSLTSTLSYRSSSQQFEIRTPMLDQKGFSLLDASAVYSLPGGRWTIGLHGKNLTDTRYITAGYNFLRQNPWTGAFILASGAPGLSSTLGREGILTAYYGNPRQIFLSAGYKF
jgi:iron complex outermembrane recepter protein